MAFGNKVFDRLQPLRTRIVAALRFHVERRVQRPLVAELDFIGLTNNHGQYSDKLKRLGLHGAADSVQRNAYYVGLRWLKLAQEHLDDANVALAAGRRRASFSRSYYAAYNASKGVRYIVAGTVSLKGDDHQRASDLPNDFPAIERWAELIPKLYEHRLLSDYDNWDSSDGVYSLTPRQAYDHAAEFVTVSISYLQAKFGI